ncbi:nickel transporter permease [Niallia sp. NCCP-28]|uniref:nickel transporter permease n=1 Tax=Niallia sp. NCCP-28 TaxID=2934712 RepID=UPI0035CFEEE6
MQPAIHRGKIPKRKKWMSIQLMFYRNNQMAYIGAIIILLFFLMAAFAPILSPYDPYKIDLTKTMQPPSMDHWLGTDDKGRDVLSRLIYGSRLTLLVGIASLAFGGAIGTALGMIAGYIGGIADTIIMRITDILLAFPGILLALAIVSALGPSLMNVAIAVGIFKIPIFIRVVRGTVLSIKNLEYIDAIQALGASHLRIITKHIFPNILSPIIVQVTLNLATVILSTAGLSFLGLGAQPPSAEWGAMLSNARSYFFTAPYLLIFPGLAISLLVLGFNLFGDGLRDALDPRMKK